MNIILDRVNTFGDSLKQVLENQARWESIWTSWAAPSASSQGPPDVSTKGSPTALTLPKYYEDHMVKMSRMAQNLANGQNSLKQQLQGLKVKGKGKKGKGKGKGGKNKGQKAKGGDWTPQKEKWPQGQGKKKWQGDGGSAPWKKKKGM